MGRPSRTRAARRDEGFTLIEILVVIVIMGLSLALVLSRGPARSVSLDAQGAVAGIAQALRLARSQAISTDRVVVITLDQARRATLTNGVPDVTVAMMTATGGRAVSQPAITFGPDGSSSGGRVVVMASAERLQVMVDWLTGRVSVANAP